MHVGLIGYGSIAKSLLELLTASPVTGVTILHRSFSPGTSPVNPHLLVRHVSSLSEFLEKPPDLVVECAGHSAVAEHVPTVLRSGIPVILASVGALADSQLENTVRRAATTGTARIILPSGAIGGLDMLRAISRHGAVEVTYQGIKPAAAWEGSPADGILNLSSLTTAKTFYSGSGREAALAFPKNANVVAALALAGAGFDKMKVDLIADPFAHANQHSYTVVSPICQYSMKIDASPTSGNARTSMTTVLSIFQEITDFEALRTTEAP